jgi:hypothetical protein
MTERRHSGSCICGAIEFEVDIDLAKPVSRCNCTYCTKLGSTGSIVKPSALVNVVGEEKATVFGRSEAGRRYFCSTCGVMVYGRGFLEFLGGDYVSINVNTLESIEPRDLEVVYFDGRHDNWMAGTRKEAWPTL